MKTRIFLVALALVLFASLSFGQNAVIAIYTQEPLLSTAANGTCTGAPLPDGTMIEIHQDINNNGTGDPNTDPLAIVGPGVDEWNFNTISMNGEAFGLGVGTFYTDPSFSSNNAVPANPRFYLVIRCSNGDVNYVSTIFTVPAAGGPLTWDATGTWTCFPCTTTPPPCTPTVGPVTLAPNAPLPGPQTATLCVQVSTTTPLQINVPVSNASNIPTVTVTPGCATGCTGDAAVGASIGTWTYSATPSPYFYAFLSATGGCCATLHLDYILAARIQSFTATPGDNSVTVAWMTASETGVTRYDITRDGVVVGRVASENSTTEHTYTYTDASAHNGTTYHYGIRVINSDNSVTETDFNVAAVPSFGAVTVTEYALIQNYPNPFNPSTQIAFDVVNTNPVTLKVFNANGQEVATLVNGATFENGRHIVNFDATSLTSGLYFYTVKIGNEFSATKKMLLVK